MRDIRQLLFTVIILVYNASWKDLEDTLLSVIKQEGADFEIIVADDGSITSFESEVDSLKKKTGFGNIKYIKSEINQGTVMNLLNATKLAKGKYIKPIGAGDLLFNESTLRNVGKFMEDGNLDFTFGLVASYCFLDKDVEFAQFIRPRDLLPYIKKQNEIIWKNNLLGDRAYGCAMFYSKDCALNTWQEMAKEANVLYCEDILTIKFAADKKLMPIFPHYVVFYKIDSGVSKVGHKKMNMLVPVDIKNYITFLCKTRNNHGLRIAKNDSRFIVSNPSNAKRRIKYIFHPNSTFFRIWNRIKEKQSKRWLNKNRMNEFNDCKINYTRMKDFEEVDNDRTIH